MLKQSSRPQFCKVVSNATPVLLVESESVAIMKITNSRQKNNVVVLINSVVRGIDHLLQSNQANNVLLQK